MKNDRKFHDLAMYMDAKKNDEINIACSSRNLMSNLYDNLIQIIRARKKLIHYRSDLVNYFLSINSNNSNEYIFANIFYEY